MKNYSSLMYAYVSVLFITCSLLSCLIGEFVIDVVSFIHFDACLSASFLVD